MLDSTVDTIGKTILLVEDDPLIAMATAMKLEREGFRVITANTGTKAVEVSRSSAGPQSGLPVRQQTVQ